MIERITLEFKMQSMFKVSWRGLVPEASPRPQKSIIIPFIYLGTDIKFCIDMYSRKGDFQLRRYVRDYYGTENKAGDSIIFILAGKL